MDIPFSVRASRDQNGCIRVRYGIALWYRLAASGIFAAIVATVIAAGGTGPVGYVALTLSAIAAAWNESWVFDTGRRAVSGGAGLFRFFRPRKISFDEIEEIVLVEFHRGSFSGAAAEGGLPGAQARIALALKGAPIVTLNSVSLKNYSSLRRDALLISKLTGLLIKTK